MPHGEVSGLERSVILDQNTTFGVLRLTLHPTGYAWRFQPEAGKSWTDSGAASYH